MPMVGIFLPKEVERLIEDGKNEYFWNHIRKVVVTHIKMFLNESNHDFFKVTTRHSNDMSYI